MPGFALFGIALGFVYASSPGLLVRDTKAERETQWAFERDA